MKDFGIILLSIREFFCEVHLGSAKPNYFESGGTLLPYYIIYDLLLYYNKMLEMRICILVQTTSNPADGFLSDSCSPSFSEEMFWVDLMTMQNFLKT